MPNFTAIVHAENGEDWQCFENPESVIVAFTPAEVRKALQHIDELSTEGFTAVGYVSYEAAAAFDATFTTQQTDRPLLKFGIFRESSRWNPPANPPPLNLTLAPELGKPDYDLAISRIKRSLEAGDSYQVNFTQRLRGHYESRPIDLFAALIVAQPSRHAFFLQDDNEAICSVSPELFFSLAGDDITMEPMKGTRPRASDIASDQQLRKQLLDSDKERAENLMIVDMVRNDLSRIAERGSVQVTELFKILKLPTVWQQISVVKARTTASLLELFTALFPCASITGAPKKQTMSIISDLERSPRGIYTGALGVVRPGRNMHFNVGIRSLHLDLPSGHANYGTGGGIVWDSQANEEWQETRVKAQLLENTDSFWQLLETMAYSPETGIAYIDQHLARLHDSARYFDIKYDQTALRKLLCEFRADTHQRLRLLVNHLGKITLESSPLVQSDEPVRLSFAQQAVHSGNVFLHHKTTHRRIYELAKTGIGPDTDDVILWNERGEITETTIYNLFLEFSGELLTPAQSSGLLPGTLRAHLLATGQCDEAVLTRQDVQRADRILVGNSVRGLREATVTSY